MKLARRNEFQLEELQQTDIHNLVDPELERRGKWIALVSYTFTLGPTRGNPRVQHYHHN